MFMIGLRKVKEKAKNHKCHSNGYWSSMILIDKIFKYFFYSSYLAFMQTPKAIWWFHEILVKIVRMILRREYSFATIQILSKKETSKLTMIFLPCHSYFTWNQFVFWQYQRPAVRFSFWYPDLLHDWQISSSCIIWSEGQKKIVNFQAAKSPNFGIISSNQFLPSQSLSWNVSTSCWWIWIQNSDMEKRFQVKSVVRQKNS